MKFPKNLLNDEISFGRMEEIGDCTEKSISP